MMLLFSRFCRLIFVLSVVYVLYGCERTKPIITVPIRETTRALSSLFVQLPQCVNSDPAIPLTTPKRVFLRVNIDVESLTTYEDWAARFAEHSAMEIDLWRGRENSRERGFLDWRFADVTEMCTYFEDARVRRDLGELPLISNAIALSTDILTLTEKSVADNNPSAERVSLNLQPGLSMGTACGVFAIDTCHRERFSVSTGGLTNGGLRKLLSGEVSEPRDCRLI